jgi:hypothetical protein
VKPPKRDRQPSRHRAPCSARRSKLSRCRTQSAGEQRGARSASDGALKRSCRRALICWIDMKEHARPPTPAPGECRRGGCIARPPRSACCGQFEVRQLTPSALDEELHRLSVPGLCTRRRLGASDSVCNG